MGRRLTQLETQLKETRRAIKLQRAENDRRLGELNNENARIRDFQSKVPSTDAFFALADRVKLLERQQSESAGRLGGQVEAQGQGNNDRAFLVAVVAVVVALIGAAAGVLATYFAVHH